MTDPRPPLRRGNARAEQIPITWVAPEGSETAPKLVIWLAPGLMEMQAVEPVLERLAGRGFRGKRPDDRWLRTIHDATRRSTAA